MKNTVKPVVSGVLALFMLTSNVNAKARVTRATKVNEAGILAKANVAFSKTTDALSAVNERALNDFQKRYANVANADWRNTSDGGYFASFIHDDVKTIVTYNAKGSFQGTIKYYNEDKLDANVKALVEDTYYDYDLLKVAEVSASNDTVYVIYIQGKKYLKVLTVYNGEMQEAGSYLKG